MSALYTEVFDGIRISIYHDPGTPNPYEDMDFLGGILLRYSDWKSYEAPRHTFFLAEGTEELEYHHWYYDAFAPESAFDGYDHGPARLERELRRFRYEWRVISRSAYLGTLSVSEPNAPIPNDGSCEGLVFASPHQMRTYFQRDRATRRIRQKTQEILRGQAHTLSEWAVGNVYWFELEAFVHGPYNTEGWLPIDSLGGIYNDEDDTFIETSYVAKEARRWATSWLEDHPDYIDPTLAEEAA